MAEIISGPGAAVHRPRNLDWKRAAALLYGDWGTSKAYVIGLAFLAAGYASLPIILAVCVLTGLVGINYAVICRYFPDGGGVYSAARSQRGHFDRRGVSAHRRLLGNGGDQRSVRLSVSRRAASRKIRGAVDPNNRL